MQSTLRLEWEKEVEKRMLLSKRYLINEDLYKVNKDFNFTRLSYASGVENVSGIMTKVNNKTIEYIVYKNDSDGNLEIKELCEDFSIALDRARTIYNSYLNESKLVLN